MAETRERIAATLIPASVFVLCLGMAAQAAIVHDLPVDRSTSVMGVMVACTGNGESEQDEARWHSYSVKLEAVGGYGQYLADEEITLQGPYRAQPLRVKCDAPWVLLRLEPGQYHATIQLPNAAAKWISFSVPRHGQRDVIVRFPGLVVANTKFHNYVALPENINMDVTQGVSITRQNGVQ